MIQELIEAKVNAMDANSMTYNFLHADVEWQNLEADNETLPAVFMDMPVQFTPIVKVGGAYERKYSINCLFLFKSNLDDNADQRYSSLKLAENAQRQFHLMIDNDNANFKGVEVGQCFQVMNFLDCNLDGIVMPFTFTERNSDSVCIPSSDPVCRPVTYLIKDEDDNILYSGSVASGGTLIKAIQSGQVKNSLGTVLGTVLAEGELALSDVDNIDSDGSTVPTPAGVAFTCTPVSPCDDATAVLKDTDGTTISTTNIASGASADITAPKATYTVQYESGTPIESGSIVSGGSALIEVPDCPVVGEWERPSSWLPRPTLSTGLYFLIEHFEGVTQTLFYYSSENTDIYIDGVLFTSVSGYTQSFYDIDGDIYGVMYGGRKFSWIFMDTAGSNPTFFFNDNSFTENPNQNKFINILEELINYDTITKYDRADTGSVYRINRNPLNIYFKPSIVVSNCQSLFRGSSPVNIENFPVLRGHCGEVFRDSLITPTELDLSLVTSLGYGFFATDKPSLRVINFINTGLLSDLDLSFFGTKNVITLTFDDLSGCTSASNCFTNAIKLQRLILNGLTVSFNITNCYSMSEYALIDMVASLADMTSFASPTITCSGIPNIATFATFIANATAKNWTVSY